MDPAGQAPLYLNWSLWATVIAVLALILSQLPPVRILVRRTRLQVEPYDRLNVNHWLGNPNVNLHLLLTNAGGREVRVLSLELMFHEEDGKSFSLPAQSFSRPGAAQGSLIFTRFVLKPDEEWGNFVSFFAPFSMADERLSKQITKELKIDIQEKIRKRPQEPVERKELVEAEPGLVQPVQAFFSARNRWHAGEYAAEVRVTAKPKRASVTRRFRFTLFESDILELVEATSRYKYGAGVYFPDDEAPGVFPRIKDLE